jgi:hypothetical protein
MPRRTAGISMIIVSAMLYATRYLAAAIFGSGVISWSQELFQAMLQYIGQGLTIWSVVALVAGISYLVWAEVDEIRVRRASH